jgi:hypothetical protein
LMGNFRPNPLHDRVSDDGKPCLGLCRLVEMNCG